MVSAGVPLVQVAQVLRHHSLQTTALYANPRELHQPGEKPQVSWSAQVPNGSGSPMADAC